MKKEMWENKSVKSNLIGFIYILPAFIIIGTFIIYPSIKVFVMSFYTKYNFFKHKVFEYGIDNYITLFNDTDFSIALKNTLIFVVCVVPVSIILSLIISIFLTKNTKFNRFLRSVYFLPFVTSTVAVGVVWRWIFHSQYGLMNYFLGIFGIYPIKWLTDPNYSMLALIILSIWRTLGYNILILLTGLKNIPEEYYEAADIDGASKINQVFTITLPLLFRTLFFVTTTSLIGSFKVFSEVYSLFAKSSGPLKSCLTLVYYIYDKLVNFHSYGLASAASVFLFLIILGITAIELSIAKLIDKRLYGRQE